MEIYDYHNYEQLYFFSSCKNGLKGLIKKIDHYLKIADEKEKELGPTITSNVITNRSYTKRNMYYNLRNCVIIVLGNYFLDRNKTLFNLLEEYNKKLSDINTHLLFIRGENDNQDIFFNKEINFTNIKTLLDYSVIKVAKHSILAIGGNISIDRAWKKEYGTVISKCLYWENEKTEYNKELLDEILSSIHIDAIATISCPSFVSMPIDSYSKEWINSDESLKDDIIQERIVMDEIYHQCILNKNMPHMWVFNQPKGQDEVYLNNIMFKGFHDSTFFNFTSWMEQVETTDDEYESDSINMNFDEELEDYENMVFGDNLVEE